MVGLEFQRQQIYRGLDKWWAEELTYQLNKNEFENAPTENIHSWIIKKSGIEYTVFDP